MNFKKKWIKYKKTSQNLLGDEKWIKKNYGINLKKVVK